MKMGSTENLEREREKALNNMLSGKENNNDTDEVARKISIAELVRRRLNIFIHSTTFGHAYTYLFVALSIFSCCQYIYQTYIDFQPHPTQKIWVLNHCYMFSNF